jgi:hypothetical protein
VPRPHRVDEWGIGPRVAELWALGRRGRSIAKEVMPAFEAWANRTGHPVPSPEAVAMAITRYMETNPVDRRTKQARAQSKAVELAEQATAQLVRGQLDAFATIQAYVDRLNAEVAKLESLKEIHPITGDPVVPDFGSYFGAMTALSREMRGWMSLFVDIRDRLAQHEQYEQAYATILSAVRECCPPDIQERIAERLRADPAVAAILRGTVGGAA